MNTGEVAKKRRLTQEDCDTVRLLLARRRTLKEIAEIIEVDPSTVGKIRLANYDLNTYLEHRKAMNRKTAENKRAAEEKKAARDQLVNDMKDFQAFKVYNEQLEVPGQMKMELEPEKKDPSPAAQDDAKSMMKFQAAMMDKLLKKLDELIGAIKGGAAE